MTFKTAHIRLQNFTALVVETNCKYMSRLYALVTIFAKNMGEILQHLIPKDQGSSPLVKSVVLTYINATEDQISTLKCKDKDGAEENNHIQK